VLIKGEWQSEGISGLERVIERKWRKILLSEYPCRGDRSRLFSLDFLYCGTQYSAGLVLDKLTIHPIYYSKEPRVGKDRFSLSVSSCHFSAHVIQTEDTALLRPLLRSGTHCSLLRERRSATARLPHRANSVVGLANRDPSFVTLRACVARSFHLLRTMVGYHRLQWLPSRSSTRCNARGHGKLHRTQSTIVVCARSGVFSLNLSCMSSRQIQSRRHTVDILSIQ
jgi:hypothetical protein